MWAGEKLVPEKLYLLVFSHPMPETVERLGLKTPAAFSKTEFKEWIKGYCQKVRQALKEKGTPQEEVKQFMATAKSFAPFLMKKYKDLTFHMGANCNPDGAIIFEFWPDEAQLQPSFMYIEGGLNQTKC